MVKVTEHRVLEDGSHYREYAGLHGDSKPVIGANATGCLFLEVDTGDVYAYDEHGAEWDKIAELGGSGS